MYDSARTGATFTILFAENDPENRMIIREAFMENLQDKADLRFIADAEELMDYLLHRGRYADLQLFPQPALILLDLDMPQMDCRQILTEVKQDPMLRIIPLVVWTTTRRDEDVTYCYDAGANSYIVKPSTSPDSFKLVGWLVRYWLQTVSLPKMTPRKATERRLG